MNKIILLGNPRSTNFIYKTMCRGNFPSRYMSNEGRTTKDSYISQTRLQWDNKPITDDVYLYIKLYFGNNRKNDIDNFHKLSLDAMTGIVYEDDSQIKKMTVEKHYDHDNPRIEIEVETSPNRIKEV